MAKMISDWVDIEVIRQLGKARVVNIPKTEDKPERLVTKINCEVKVTYKGKSGLFKGTEALWDVSDPDATLDQGYKTTGYFQTSATNAKKCFLNMGVGMSNDTDSVEALGITFKEI